MGKNFTITETEFPYLPKLMLATINAHSVIGSSATIRKLDEQIVEMEGMNEEGQSIMMPNGQYRKLNYYLSWSRT